MRSLLLLLTLAITTSAEKHNILLICVDDLRPELKSLGADYIQSPAMDSLVVSGRAFTRHYVQAPTCGASRYAMLTGRYGTMRQHRGNSALFHSASQPGGQVTSLPRHFRENGYRTVSIGKVSHHPGGYGGPTWDDRNLPEMPEAWDINLMPTAPWKHPLAAMHGYADGKAREKGITPALEHLKGDDRRYTDGWITQEALKHMSALAEGDEPFLLAVGIMKPHLPFACPQSYRELYREAILPPTPHPERPEGLSTWHRSGEFYDQYHHNGRDPREDAAYADELRRSYAACVTYADAQIAQILKRLEDSGLADSTIVVLWGDHGFHLGEHAIWGKHALFEESLHAPLVIRTPEMKQPGVRTDAIVESIDLFPTLCALTGTEHPSGLDGKSLVKQLADPTSEGTPAISYYRKNETIRTKRHRLIRHNGKRQDEAPKFELYDHQNGNGETHNIAADNPEIVEKLNQLLTGALE